MGGQQMDLKFEIATRTVCTSPLAGNRNRKRPNNEPRFLTYFFSSKDHRWSTYWGEGLGNDVDGRGLGDSR